MDANYKIERNTRGFFQILNQDGTVAKAFKDSLFTTEHMAKVSILTNSGKEQEKKVEGK